MAKKRVKREIRTCAAPGCDITFEVKVTSPRKYCCRGHRQHKPGCGCCICKNKRHEPKSEEHKKKIGLSLLGKNVGKVRTKEHKETYRRVNKTAQLWQDPEYREKQLKVIKAMLTGRRAKPNKPEKFLNKLLQKLFPNQWKYVGNFEEWINGKNPDFIHVSQKKIIEMNGDYWHGEKLTGRTKEEEEQQRIDLFAKEGYQTLIIWEHELEDIDLLVEKIMNFHNI